MAVSEQARRRLHEALEATLGDDNAATLMDSLPPLGWGDLATKQDLAHLATELRGEMRTGFAELRGEFRAELRDEIAGVRQDLGDLRAQMEKGFRRQTMYMASVASAAALLAGLLRPG